MVGFMNANPPSFSLGQSPGTGFNFGTSTQPAATATVSPFTALAPAITGVTAPSVLTGSGGFSFGQAASTNTPALNFGTGTAVTPSTGLLGQVATSAAPTLTSGLFGQPQSSTTSGSSSFGFGLTQPVSSSASTTGLSLGQLATSATSGLTVQTTSSGGFSLGQTATSTTSLPTGLFGQSAAQPSTGLNFGQLSSQSAAQPSTGLNFGQPSIQPAAQPSTGLNFGQPSSQPAAQPSTGLNFGLSTTATSSGPFGQTQSTATSSGLNFGAPASSSSAGFSFSNTPSSSSSGFSLGTSNLGLGGNSLQTSVTSTTSFGLGGSLLTSSTVGLGGIQPTTVDSGGSGNIAGKGDGKSAKEAPLPQDIFATVMLFETYKDAEKKCSEDNVRQTAAPFHKLVEDTKKLRQHIHKLSNQHTQLHASARKLKSSVIQEAENVEMARRTQDMPMNLQGNNNAPEQFFLRLVRSFEERMTFCRNKIEEVEKCARNSGNATDISPEEMKEILKKEHHMVKMLAAKIYALRNQLINYSSQSSNPDVRPEALFKPLSADINVGLLNKNSSVLRPALGDTGSGLLHFQNGQQKAKALSLGASPPTLPLSQSSIPNLLGSTNQSSIFSSSTNPGFGSSSMNFGSNTSSFNLGPKPAFGQATPNSSSLFGNQTFNQNTGTMFGVGSNNTSLFGNAKSMKK